VSIPDKLLAGLKSQQQSFALESLKRPQNRDTYQYGYLVGVVAGYEASINVLLSLLDEAKNGKDDI
jgi:hypothetical protein